MPSKFRRTFRSCLAELAINPWLRGEYLYALVCGLILVSFGRSVRADYQEAFESAEISWRFADADSGYRVVVHQRTNQVAHSGQASEYLQLVAGPGTYIHLIHDIPHTRVIAELNPRIWVKADRVGIQFMVRVVLPRSLDPRTGQPLMSLLRGDIYDRVGAWQALSIRQVDQLLSRQVRVLRTQFGPDVDPREAYLDLVVLNAFGGTGATNLWIDDLELNGQVPQVQFTSQPTAQGAVPGPGPGAGPLPPSAAPRAAEHVRLQGSVLLAKGRPFFPRAVEHNGEALEWLQSLGFNTLKLKGPATDIQLREAERLGLWLIAPPPNDLALSAAYDPLLAWDLGSQLKEDRLELTRQWSSQLRRADSRPDRPLLCGPDERLWGYSRFTNLLQLAAPPAGGAVSFANYGAWVRQRPGLARPGTPCWATIPTEPHPALLEQWNAFGLEPPVSLTTEPEQIMLLAYQALASGARGLVFASRSPLDRTDPDSELRARTLRRLNLELEFLEPWVAGGANATDLDSGDPSIRMSLLQTEKAQLLIVIDQSPGQQFTVGPPPEKAMPLIVPSLINAPQVYRITAAGLRTITHRRVAGGSRILLEEPGLVSLVAITQDPLVVNHLARVQALNKTEFAKLHHAMAVRELQLVEQVHSRLTGAAMPPKQIADALVQARSTLRHCEMLLGASDFQAAGMFAERSVNLLSLVRRHHWDQASRSFPSPVASPYCVSLSALPAHWDLAQRLQTAVPWEGNALPAGDFENLDHLRAAGWRNESLAAPPVQAHVELSPESPHSGQAALLLRAASSDTQNVTPIVESPPVQILSAPVRVRSGQLIKVQGWVRVPQRITGSPDGLMIYDTLAGPALAERISETGGWREFVLYRAAPYGGDVSVVLALTGLGEAWIDDVTISLHDPVAARSARDRQDQAKRLPPVTDRTR